MPPPNSFPFTLSCRGHLLVVLPHVSFSAVFLRNAICRVSRWGETLFISAWRVRGVACRKPSPAFSWWRSKFALRQGSLRYAAENTAVFCLDPQILDRCGYSRLET